MKRMQIYLENDEYEALRSRAFKLRESISSVLRKLVRRDVMRGSAKRKRYAEGLLDMAGTLRESRADVSERHDEYLWGDVERRIPRSN